MLMDEGISSSTVIPLTERLLNDAGGWQAMKIARSLHSAGRVSEASYEPPILQGHVREGNTEYKSGLRIGSKTDIENLCTCRESRGRGLICAHSLAVGLAVLKPLAPSATASPSEKQAPQVPAEVGILRATGNRVFSSSEGSALELTFIFPPNLPDAWDKGAINLGVECLIDGNRKLLSAIGTNTIYRCQPEDWTALEKLLSLTAKELPGILTLKRDQTSRVLAFIVNHPRVMLGRNGKLAVGEPVRLTVQGKMLEDGSVHLEVRLPEGARIMAAEAGAWLWKPGQVSAIAPGLPAAYQSLLRQPVTIPGDGVADFMTRELPVLAQYFEIQGLEANTVGLPTSNVSDGGAGDLTFVLRLEGSLNYLAAHLESRTAKRRTTLTSPGIRPAHAAETAALYRLRRCGFDGPTSKGELVLRGEHDILRFFAEELPHLQKEWEVSIGERFSHVTRDFERVTPQLDIRGSGENWFEVGFELATESGERLSAHEIRRLLGSGRRTVRLANQKTAVISEGLLDEFQTLLGDTNPNQPQLGTYRFDRRDALAFGAYADSSGARFGGPKAGQFDPERTLFRRPAEAPNLERFKDMLRHYQGDGVIWLNRLSSNGFAGILADEMGLGKTLQTLVYMSLKEGPKLVVCPASLTLNWQREAERFTPELKPQILAELATEQIPAALKEPRLFITSYGLLRRDVDVLRQTRFEVAALDEAQHIKNPDSQAARAAFRLNAETRVALTGTPIENGVRDIWSIMNFLMPGYLGRREDFRERFEVPIQSQSNSPEQQRLVRRLSPFILRRTKAQVATELPEKIQQVSFVELSRKQKALYETLLRAARQSLEVAGKSGARGSSKMAVFTALLRLRQVCCDPRLLGEEGVEPDVEPEVNSAKLELLEELLQDAIDDGHRILVFSQFATMLGLIQDRLKAMTIDHCYLDGSTRNRQSEVDRFQTGNVPVFLVSLKAGGVGLNLTAADTVIHYDPWWNPAVEAQATDRAHRIGQIRTVQVYKLITRGTVEERILSLQSKKRELTAGLVDSENPMMSGLTDDDLNELVR
jgi:SNF2-related domain/Helicase conserved C-terminal domain/Bacterial SNF2 helicase associated